MKFSKLMREGELDQIKKLATDQMDAKVKTVLFDKIDASKKTIGRRLATQAIRQSR